MNISGHRIQSIQHKLYFKRIAKKFHLSLLLLTISCLGMAQFNPLNNHLFPVRIDEKWGYIDSKGEIVLEVKYELALPFSEGYALIQEEGELAFINTKGEKVMIPKDNYYVNKKVQEDMLAYKCDYGDGFYSMKEEEYLPPKFDFVKPYSENLAAFRDRHTKLYGFINKKNEIEIPAQFSDCGNFSDGLCRVKFDGQWAFINTDGRLNCMNKYTYVTDYSEEIAGVWDSSNEVKYINKENKVLFTHQIFKDVNNLPAQFSLPIYTFSDGLVKVIDANAGLYGYMNKEGVLEIRYQFKKAGDFKNGLAAVKYGEKWGFINKKGEFPISAQFDFAEDFNNGLAAVYRGGNAEDFKNHKEGVSMAYINKKGVIIWDFSR